MRDDAQDYALLVRWRNEPHVARWWTTDDEPSSISLEHVVERYGPRTEDDADSTSCLIELAGRPIGYIQFYRWGDFAEEARAMGLELRDDAFGIDVFIGEPKLVGRGFGSRAVDLLARYLIDERDATQVAIVTALDNINAQRAYEKAGFGKVGELLDTDVRDGERVRSWLMTRDLPS
jgi:aminoglycoside 6'-N-acetyltransferase